MEAGSILTADVLDIIFDARNKAYGAYDLRKNYQRRLVKAVIVTSSFVVLTCVTYVVLGSMKPAKEQLVVDGTVTLEKIPPPVEPKTELPPPPPPPPPPAPSVKMLALTPPLIVKDADVKPEDIPPTTDDLETAKIGTVNSPGTDDVGITGQPVEPAKGIVETPKKVGNDEPFYIVEIESQYPGGLGAWSTFLNRNLVYPQAAIDDEKQGTVTVQFIVDTEGRVSDVQAISGPEELRAAAVAVIRKSGNWTVAIQNGTKVKSYKKQPITFRLSE